MKKYLVSVILLTVVLLIGNKLRTFSYASVPHPGEVADEYAWGWLGLSLINDKYPVSWSLNSYKNTTYQKINVDFLYDKNSQTPPFAIVRPNFDNPPLFGLITGGYAFFKGVRSFQEASVAILRRPMLKIAALTTILIFILASRFYGQAAGLLAAFLYSIIPTMVISSRLALIENGYIPLFLAGLIFSDLYFEKRKKIFWITAVFLATVAILFKLSAIAVSLSLICLAVIYGKKDRMFLILSILAGVSIAVLAFFSYGFLIDKKTFLDIFWQNSQRFYGAGAEIVLQIITQSRLTTNKFLTDGWIFLGWICLFLVSFGEWKKTKGGIYSTAAALSCLMILIIFGGESYGWYKYPLFPFLAITIARILQKLYLKPNLLVFSSLAFLPFGSAVHRILGIIEFQKYVTYFKLFSLFIFFLFVFSLFFKKKEILLLRLFMIVVITFLVWLSIKEIFYYTIDKWYFVT